MAKKITRNKRKKEKPSASLNWANNSCDEGSIYQLNMQIMKEYYPNLAQGVEDNPSKNRFQIIKTGLQLTPNLYNEEKKLYYYDVNDPNQDVEDQIKALKLKNARMAVFLGIGLGYELLYYMKNEVLKQNTNCIIIIEKDLEIFQAALKTIDLRGFLKNPNFKLIIGKEEGELYTQFRDFFHENDRYYLLKAIKAIYHPSALRLNKDYYIRALQLLKDAASQQVLYFGNDPYDSLLGIENMLANLNEIITNPGINLLSNRFAGKPAIVVSTGPSLNKNKHLLKGIEDKALIIAADASLKVLMDIGLKPHLVTSLERIIEIANLFEGYTKDEVEEVYLAACPVIPQKVYEVYPGPRLIVYRNFDHFKWLGIERGILDIKLSAGNMAFKVAEYLGCNPIILIGQDLAYSRDGRSHASGATYGENQEIPGEIMTVMGNDQQPIQTNRVFYDFLRGYEMDLLKYSGTCINATEGGAYIQGTQIMTFQEAIDNYIKDEFYPLENIENNLAVFTSQEAEQDLQRVFFLIDNTIKELNEIVMYCSEGINKCEKYQGLLRDCFNNIEVINGLRQQLLDIENDVMEYKDKCMQLYNTFQLFLAHVFQSYVIKFEMEMIAVPEKYDDPAKARVEVILRQAEWYAVVGDLATICLNSLIKSRDKLKEIL